METPGRLSAPEPSSGGTMPDRRDDLGGPFKTGNGYGPGEEGQGREEAGTIVDAAHCYRDLRPGLPKSAVKPLP